MIENEHKTLGDLWKKVSEKTAEKKYQKFKNLLLDDFDNLFNDEGFGQGGQSAICSVTGEETEKVTEIDEDVKISPQVQEQKEIGQALAKNDYIIFSNHRQPNLKVNSYGSLVGRNYWLLTNKDLVQTENTEVCLTVKIEINFIKPQSTSTKNIAYSYRFYGGNEVAFDKKGKAKNFEQLAGIDREDNENDNSPIVKSECTGSFNRLAILRMDVDGLGQIFIKGFNKETASFSAYATLSGQLDWFFSGYLNTIRSKEDYKDWVNIIYSGGDDVFAVGRWDKTIAFAEEIQSEFKLFTGREDITVSAGISIVTPKFPIAKGADLAGEAEHLAKDFKRLDKREKDALCLFGIAVGWEEFKIIKDIKDFWLEHLEGENPILSRGLLQKVFTWYAISKRKDKNENPNLSWKWNTAYSLKRYEVKDNKKKNDALKMIEIALLCNQFGGKPIRFDVFVVASRWAELILRDK
ncbi:type III-A CRISPR-associated protein Cas10/Csm1 [Flectobacillus sp. BAB-3569]|nr:type III-A CRISPR-associated protein Cas10/Csm1 [Flectobacillus sp. BAB-3569]